MLLGGGLLPNIGMAAGVPFETAWTGAAAAQSLTPSGNVYVNRVASDLYHVYRPLGGYYWMRHRIFANGSPFAWNETVIREAHNFVSCRTGTSGVTYSGAWSEALASAYDVYPDGMVRYVTSASGSPYIDIDITGGGDVHVVFVGRDSGGYVKCEIDGDTELCNELPTNGTYRYLDTYRGAAGSALVYRRVVKIASGLSSGSHTIRLTVMSDKNASSSGNRFYYCGLLYTVANPQLAAWDPPEWQPLTAYAQHQRVRVEDRLYSANVAGTTSSTAPTHTSGTAVDGTVTWVILNQNPYMLNAARLQPQGSHLEYAYQIQPDGASAKEDVGSLVHGNETLNTATWTVDGTPVSLAIGEWSNGAEIKLTQAITATHTEAAGSVNETTLVHTFTPTKTIVKHTHDWQQDAQVGWFYAHMWGNLHWDAAGYDEYGIDYMASPQGGTKSIADYYATTANYQGQTTDYVQAMWGDILGNDGYNNLPNAFSQDNSQHSAIGIVAVKPTSMAGYAGPNTLKAAMLMNQAGGTAPGSSDVGAKLYFERVNSAGVAVSSGDTWICEATYYLYLAESPTVAFPPA